MPTLITAIIRPYALDGAKQALQRAGVAGITVSEVRGSGRQGGHSETYRGTEYQVDLLPKVHLESVVASEDAAAIVAVIADAVRTGEIGDGKIWTSPVEDLVRIRTGEVGDLAL